MQKYSGKKVMSATYSQMAHQICTCIYEYIHTYYTQTHIYREKRDRDREKERYREREEKQMWQKVNW